MIHLPGAPPLPLSTLERVGFCGGEGVAGEKEVLWDREGG